MSLFKINSLYNDLLYTNCMNNVMVTCHGAALEGGELDARGGGGVAGSNA